MANLRKDFNRIMKNKCDRSYTFSGNERKLFKYINVLLYRIVSITLKLFKT
jgi:hypothetical protein